MQTTTAIYGQIIPGWIGGEEIGRGKAMRCDVRGEMLSSRMSLGGKQQAWGHPPLIVVETTRTDVAGGWLVDRSVTKQFRLYSAQSRGPPNQFQLESGIFAGQPGHGETISNLSY